MRERVAEGRVRGKRRMRGIFNPIFQAVED
jgi:hypothetical protein